MSPAKTEATKSPAKVFIVDDHPIVREGLALRISDQPDLEVCGEASDVADALAQLAAAQPDIIIVDISLKSGNGLDLIKRIRARDENARILVWSMYNDRLYAERALRAGALGYLNKEEATDSLVQAIRRVLEGKVYLSEPMAEQILSRTVGLTSAPASATLEEVLSDRELEVFQLIGQGLENQRIAQRMKVSPKTVETYQARIKAKLNLGSGRELIRRAVQWVQENE